jgi:CRP/FNR family transcriptional regulator, cyclic AMP receptor protein
MAWSGFNLIIGSYTVTWIEMIGYAGTISALMMFCMTTMLHLRVVALVTSVFLFVFAFLSDIYPTMVLQMLLFPINGYKLLQILRLVGSSEKPADQGGLSFASLKPLMTRRRLAAGTTLIRKGDVADKLYYLDEGRLAIAEIGKVLEPGAVTGEIGVFAADQRRTATVVCQTDCVVYELTERRTKELYFQNPAFGFAVMQLIITRLVENQQSAPPRVAAPPVAPAEPAVLDVPGVSLVPEAPPIVARAAAS